MDNLSQLERLFQKVYDYGPSGMLGSRIRVQDLDGNTVSGEFVGLFIDDSTGDLSICIRRQANLVLDVLHPSRLLPNEEE